MLNEPTSRRMFLLMAGAALPGNSGCMAADHGIKITSVGAEWPQLSKSTSEAADKAHSAGAEYVSCTNILHRRPFTADDARRAAVASERRRANPAVA